jgi:hypothetical protein
LVHGHDVGDLRVAPTVPGFHAHGVPQAHVRLFPESDGILAGEELVEAPLTSFT